MNGNKLCYSIIWLKSGPDKYCGKETYQWELQAANLVVFIVWNKKCSEVATLTRLVSWRVVNGLVNLPRTWKEQDKDWWQGCLRERYLEDRHCVTVYAHVHFQWRVPGERFLSKIRWVRWPILWRWGSLFPQLLHYCPVYNPQIAAGTEAMHGLNHMGFPLRMICSWQLLTGNSLAWHAHVHYLAAGWSHWIVSIMNRW